MTMCFSIRCLPTMIFGTGLGGHSVHGGFFLLRVGVKLNNAEMIDDALNQYYWHIHYLQNPETGLYYHGYNNITGDHMSGFFTGEGQMPGPPIPCRR